VQAKSFRGSESLGPIDRLKGLFVTIERKFLCLAIPQRRQKQEDSTFAALN
jgi:hypothetical protein